MPIIGTQQDDEGLDPNQQTHGAGTYVPPATSPGGVSPSGGGSGFVGGGGGQGATTTAAPTSAGNSSAPTHDASNGNYTNLLSYLGANQGAGKTMGDTVSGMASSAGNAADKGLNMYSGEAATDIKGGTKTGNSSTVKNADGSTTTTGGSETYNGPADSAHLTGVAGTDATAAQSALNNLQGMAKNAAGGTSGNAALLKGAYNTPNYSTGENTFDSAILGGTQGGQSALQSIQTQSGAEGAKFDAANAGIDTAARDANAAANAYKPASFTTTPVQTVKPAEGPVAIQTAPATTAVATAKPTTVKSIPAPTAASTASAVGKTVGKAVGNPVGGTKDNAAKIAADLAAAQQAAINAAKKAAPAPSPTINIPNPVQGWVSGGTSGAQNQGNKWINGAVNEAHKLGLADGGEVGDQSDLISMAGKLAPLVLMLKNGGPVPGEPKFPGRDDPRNDTVDAKVTPKEIILPLTITQSDNPPKRAAEFVKKVQSKEPEHKGLDGLVKYCMGGRS